MGAGVYGTDNMKRAAPVAPAGWFMPAGMHGTPAAVPAAPNFGMVAAAHAMAASMAATSPQGMAAASAAGLAQGMSSTSVSQGMAGLQQVANLQQVGMMQ